MIVERMAADLGITPQFIHHFARGASHAYKSYPLRKRGGGSRTIEHPSKQLKALQRWFLHYVIELLPVHPVAMAYRKNVTILDNARVHSNSKFLLRMDCENFFPSITEDDLIRYILYHPDLFTGWDPSDVQVFCKIVCRGGRLTIGAPTSPALSNVICFDMDATLVDLCSKRTVNYTRYADDLFFSTSTPNILKVLEAEVTQVVEGPNLPIGLKINSSKTRHSSRRGARRATGIVLGSDGKPYIGRSLKRRIRSLIHKVDSLTPKARRSLAGLVPMHQGLIRTFSTA